MRALMLAFALLSGVSVPAFAEVYAPESFTLENGLQVIIVTNRRAPVVTHMLWYRTGAADEPPGQSGIAHYLEHLMFKGTKEVPPQEFSKIVARNGGRDNAMTSWDYTAYFQNIAVDRLETVMRLEADRMTNLQLSDAVTLPERDVILAERGQVVERDPARRLGEAAYAALFPHHPYGIPIIGWRHEMENLSREDAENWYRRWYAPNNAVLTLVGDIDAETARPLVERYYGAIPARDVPARTRLQDPPLDSAVTVRLRDAEVRQPSWTRYYRAPSYRTAKGDEAYALQLVADALGGGATGRLYQALVLEQDIAVSAGAWYSPTRLDETVFGLFVTPAPGVAIETIDAAIEAEIADFLAEGVGAERLATSKQRVRDAAVLARDSLMRPAYAFGMALTTGGDIDQVEQWPARIEAVTLAAADQAARAVLDVPFHVTSILLPARETASVRPASDSPAGAGDGHGETTRPQGR